MSDEKIQSNTPSLKNIFNTIVMFSMLLELNLINKILYFYFSFYLEGNQV